MATQERKNGKTPNGGDHSIVYYTDASGKPVDKAKAKQAKIVEYKGKKVIKTTYGTL